MSPPFALAAAIAADAWLAGLLDPGARRARFVTKPAIVPLAALALRDRPDGPLTGSARFALAAGWAGDVALLGRGSRAFVAGLACFATGHAALLSGLLRHQAPSSAARGLPLAALGLGAALGPALAAAAQRRAPGLGPPVLAYAALLAATTAAASHLHDDLPAQARARLASGSWAFLVSDGVLGARTFVLDAPSPVAERVVMVTYGAAQWLIASGAARA